MVEWMKVLQSSIDNSEVKRALNLASLKVLVALDAFMNE
jgi:hypothetical protein